MANRLGTEMTTIITTLMTAMSAKKVDSSNKVQQPNKQAAKLGIPTRTHTLTNTLCERLQMYGVVRVCRGAGRQQKQLVFKYHDLFAVVCDDQQLRCGT